MKTSSNPLPELSKSRYEAQVPIYMFEEIRFSLDSCGQIQIFGLPTHRRPILEAYNDPRPFLDSVSCL